MISSNKGGVHKERIQSVVYLFFLNTNNQAIKQSSKQMWFSTWIDLTGILVVEQHGRDHPLEALLRPGQRVLRALQLQHLHYFSWRTTYNDSIVRGQVTEIFQRHVDKNPYICRSESKPPPWITIDWLGMKNTCNFCVRCDVEGPPPTKHRCKPFFTSSWTHWPTLMTHSEYYYIFGPC